MFVNRVSTVIPGPKNTLCVVQLEFPASLESRDPRVQRVLRDHLEIIDLMD